MYCGYDAEYDCPSGGPGCVFGMGPSWMMALMVAKAPNSVCLMSAAFRPRDELDVPEE